MAEAHLEVTEVAGNQIHDGFGDVEELQSELNEFVRYGPIGVGDIQPHHVEITFFLLSPLDLPPNH